MIRVLARLRWRRWYRRVLRRRARIMREHGIPAILGLHDLDEHHHDWQERPLPPHSVQYERCTECAAHRLTRVHWSD